MIDYVLVRSKRSKRNSRPVKSSLHLECLENRCLLAAWEPVGPAPIINGGTEKVSPRNEVSGAIHAVIAHPTDEDIIYIGATNGGVWKTTNASATSPTWTPLIDDAPSLSIGAMAMDPANSDRIVVGAGRTSSFAEGGDLFGLVITEDGGNSWRLIDDPLLAGKNISGLAINGNTIVATAGGGNFDGRGFVFDVKPKGGIFRSVDGGDTWESIEVLIRDPLHPDDPVDFEVFDLVADPTNPTRFYAGVGQQGIFRTDNAGLTWQNVTASNPRIVAIQTLIQNARLELNNIEMSVASDGRIYAAIITLGQPVYIGYSDDLGGFWTEMDIPLTEEVTGVQGISPKRKPGGQGNIHFSIVADPNDPKTVYVGGDRQDGEFSLLTGNYLGAREFSGKLFRGDTREQPLGSTVLGIGFDAAGQLVPNVQFFRDFQGVFLPSPQWEHLTHSNTIATIPEGGTRKGSAPHADSREMVVAADGQLIQTDDGGIYRRTQPLNNLGDWFSINGNLQVTEFHDIAYDSNTNIILGGTQDNGSIQQTAAGSTVWEVTPILEQDIDFSVTRNSPGDGGDVAVDDTSRPGFSFRYTSAQNLGGFRRQLIDANNNIVTETNLVPPIGNFVTPVELNKIDQTRLVVGGAFSIFESNDQGDSFTPVPGPSLLGGPGIAGIDQNAIVYGGTRRGVPNPDVLYVGTAGEVLVRTERDGELFLTEAQFPGGDVRDIVLDTNDWMTSFVIDRDKIFMSRDLGDTWIDITGDVNLEGGGELRSLEFVRSGGTGRIVLGTDFGAFVASTSEPTNWQEIGNLPNAPVYDMDYDPQDDVLVVGTMGRGAFTLKDASKNLGQDTNGATNNIVRGSKWNDLNGNGIREALEPGIPNVWIYVDINGDNRISIGEPANRTDASGRFLIRDVPSGNFAVREITPNGWVQTFPATPQGEHAISFAGGTDTTVNFANARGSGMDSGFDFGDALAPYDALATHGIITGFHLGGTVDGEFQPNADDGDDGVRFSSDVFPGGSTVIEVDISSGTQPAGLLQAWIDYNGDGIWSNDEQIIKDYRVVEGTNRFDILVPANAIVDSVVARFRYAYELGLNATAPAIAGEVEDYVVNIVPSGPSANDDSFEISENSKSQILQVTANDERRANARIRIDSVTDPTNGGKASISSDGLSISYQPLADFWGIETFQYRVTDRNGQSDTATVTIDVLPNVVRISLSVVNANGSPIPSLKIGDEFVLQGIVEDRRDNPTGVFSAYLDVDYMSSLATITGPIRYGVDYPNQRSGDIAVEGLIDEVGAFADSERVGSGPKMLFSVTMVANAAGTLVFRASPADVSPKNDVHVFDSNDQVPDDRIEYIGTEVSISGTPNQLVTNTNPVNAMDVDNDGSIAPFDALQIINDLNDGLKFSPAGRFTDVNADGFLSPGDALIVINHLNEMVRANRAVAAVAAAIPEPVQGSSSERSQGKSIEIGHPTNRRVELNIAQAADAIFQELHENDRRDDLATDVELDIVL